MYNGKPRYVTWWTALPEMMSVRVTVPRRAGSTPGPAMGAPLVRSAGHKTESHAIFKGFGPLLHVNGSAPNVKALSASDVST